MYLLTFLFKNLTFTCFSCVLPRQSHKGHQTSSSRCPLAAEMSPVGWIPSIFIKAVKRPHHLVSRSTSDEDGNVLLFVGHAEKKSIFWSNSLRKKGTVWLQWGWLALLFYERCWKWHWMLKECNSWSYCGRLKLRANQNVKMQLVKINVIKQQKKRMKNVAADLMFFF